MEIDWFNIIQINLCVPVVGLGQLVGHGQDGQRSVLLWSKRLTDTTAVDQTSLPAFYEHLAQHLLVIFTVHMEGLRDRTNNETLVFGFLIVSNRDNLILWTHFYIFFIIVTFWF